jgi:hypothetical protein
MDRSTLSTTLACFAVFLASCAAPEQGGTDAIEDATATDEVGGDLPFAFDVPMEAPQGDGWVQPPGSAAIRFRVFDLANATYKDNQMKWTGSFAWDAATNTIAHATSWLPTDGPYPPLYDDGPVSAGGHEPEDAAAGDHVFQCEVFFVADEDTEFEYGVLNEWDRWIWLGPNGTFSVAKGSTDAIEVPGLTLPKFGDLDFSITLDLKALHPEYATITPFDPGTGEGYRVYVKSSANSWTPVELLDDGQKGDAAAGDGLYTYLHSSRLQAGGHDGLVGQGQHVQLVFVFALDGIGPDDGSEYKVTDDLGNHCAIEGVAVAAGPSASLAGESLILERDSKGKVFNTGFVVGGGMAACATDADCVDPAGATTLECDPETDACKVKGTVQPSQPTIEGLDPAWGPEAGGTDVTITGTDLRLGVAVTFGGQDATGVVRFSDTKVVATTPAHAAGKVDVVVTNPDKGSATATGGFEYKAVVVSKPSIQLVSPSKGPIEGGTEVTLTGEQFLDAPAVTFGDAAATKVTFVSATEVHAWTPAHAKGAVTVTLKNPDTGTATYPGGFEYLEEVVPPLPDWARLDEPLAVTIDAGDTTEALFAEVYEAGLTEGGAEPSGLLAQVGYGPSGSDPTAGTGWQWTDATWAHGGGTYGNNSIYTAQLTVATAGSYAFTFRFSIDAGTSWLHADTDGSGGTDAFSAAKLGTLTVNAVDPAAPKVTSVQPAHGPTKGGTAVTVTGTGLAGVTTVLVGDASVAAVAAGDGTSLTFTTPAHAMGAIALSMTNGAGKQGTKAKAFTFLPRGTPTLDGTIGSDWDATFLVATTSLAPDWGAGKNELKALHVAFDDTYLYVGVSGVVEAPNAIVGYVDRDFGAGTGYADMNALSDNTDTLDNAVSSKVVVTAAGFGADRAFGTKGMASVTESSAWPDTDKAGWRDLTQPGNFGWDAASVVTKPGGTDVEAAIKLDTLFAAATPAVGSTLAIVVRILSADGQYTSAQALPQATAAGDNWTQTQVAVVPFHP